MSMVVTCDFQIICDPTGKEAQFLGPDPARIEKLVNMRAPITQKEVRSLLDLLTQLSKFCPDHLILKGAS